jgi:hypothetical protein
MVTAHLLNHRCGASCRQHHHHPAAEANGYEVTNSCGLPAY